MEEICSQNLNPRRKILDDFNPTQRPSLITCATKLNNERWDLHHFKSASATKVLSQTKDHGPLAMVGFKKQLKPNGNAAIPITQTSQLSAIARKDPGRPHFTFFRPGCLHENCGGV